MKLYDTEVVGLESGLIGQTHLACETSWKATSQHHWECEAIVLNLPGECITTVIGSTHRIVDNPS